MQLTRTTYVKERLSSSHLYDRRRGSRSSLFRWLCEELRIHARDHGAIIVHPERFEFDIDSHFWSYEVNVYYGHVYIGKMTRLMRDDVLKVWTWAWKDVLPEHRERLAKTAVPENQHYVDMLTAGGFDGRQVRVEDLR